MAPTQGQPAQRKDPLTSFLWGLKIELVGGDKLVDSEEGTAFFKKCTGMKAEVDVQDHVQGGWMGRTHKLIGATKFPPLVLEQGFTGDVALFTWHRMKKRVTGTIFLLGPGLKPVSSWEFKKGFVSKYQGPEFDASKNEVSIESIEIHHEGLHFVVPQGGEE